MTNVLNLSKSVGDQITVDLVRNFLNANKGKDVQFDIETLGGDLATGITIHNLIKAHTGKTTANIIGLTASAGTVIAIACDEVVMSDNALFLIHNGWRSDFKGNVYDFKKAAEDLAKTDAIMIKMYREKTGMQPLAIAELMKASDWMSPSEALNYGFIDRIEISGVKIAASLVISEAKGKINNILLTKLEEKMKNPFKKTEAKAEVFNILALADGKFALINAEKAAAGVEIAAPLGATLEDGEYELADGRKIMVSGGTVTEVMEMSEPGANEGGNAEIIAGVAEMLVKSEEKIMNEVKALLKPLEAMASTHKPAKAAGPVNPGKASIEDRMLNNIEAKAAELREAAEKRRKGA